MERLLLLAGMLTSFVLGADAQMNMRNQMQVNQIHQMQQVQRHVQNQQNRPKHFNWPLKRQYPYEEIEQVMMPDGHIVEYHHVYNGPVVWDSVPYEWPYKLHFLPFAAFNCSRLAGEKITSSPLQPGFGVGMRFDWYSDERTSIYVGTGIQYSQMNLRFKGDDYFVFDIESKLNAFHIPIYFGPQFHLKNDMKIGLGAGVKFGGFISSKFQEREGMLYNASDKFDYIFCVETWFARKNLQIGFQYDWGFSGMSYIPRHSIMVFESNTRQSMVLTVGYRFWNN